MTIDYIAQNAKIIRSITNYYLHQEIEFVDFFDAMNNENRDSRQLILLIFSPIYHNHHYIYCDFLWKRYLEINFPNAILISAGFHQTSHSNYLDLFNLPTNLHRFIGKAKTVADFWNPPLNRGLDLNEKLQAFFRAHGRESLIASLHKIKRKLHLVDRELKNGQWSFLKASQEYLQSGYAIARWREFRHRWKNYYCFFNYAPFYEKFKINDSIIERIHPFFANGCKNERLFLELNCWENIQFIQKSLAEIRDCYVGEQGL